MAQKRVHKLVLNESINTIQINTHNCFEVVLETGKDDVIEVDAKMDGEYSKDLQMKVSDEGNTLILGAGFQPVFQNPNDKLSAHKVVSIALKIVVPEFKHVQIYGQSSRVMIQGNYTNLDVTLSDGTCVLRNVSEEINVKTQSGDIVLYASNGKILAETKYGELSRNPIAEGFSLYNLNSVTGNIILNKTE